MEFKTLSYVVLAIFLLGSTVIGIYDAIIATSRDGNARPLLDATVGRIIAADYLINQNVERLREGGLEQGQAANLKKDIWTNLFIFLIFVWLLYRLGKALLSVTWNPMIAVLTVLIVLVIVWAIEGAYVLFGVKENFIPFSGFVNLVRYLGTSFTA
jgi:hypothetical protein